VLRNGASAAKDLVKWKIARGGQTAEADLGDPVGGEVILGICLYDTSATPQPLLAAIVPAGGTCNGKPCWKTLATVGYRYKNKAGTADGVTDVKLRANASGELALAVRGKGGALAMPPLGLVTPAFGSASKNDGAIFKANGN
jgi:hypothetical protein